MALQDRIVRKSVDVINSISPIVFYSSFYLWVTGQISGSELSARFSLDADEITQSQSLKSIYDSFATNIEKLEYLNRLHSSLIAYENLVIDKSQLASILGL